MSLRLAGADACDEGPAVDDLQLGSDAVKAVGLCHVECCLVILREDDFVEQVMNELGQLCVLARHEVDKRLHARRVRLRNLLLWNLGKGLKSKDGDYSTFYLAVDLQDFRSGVKVVNNDAE